MASVIDPEYLDLTLQKDPRCLVTLAHYGAVLHIMIKAWWMEGWGKSLINLAVENLADNFSVIDLVACSYHQWR
jgi:hypothetical protein